jgi:hypothetical protein
MKKGNADVAENIENSSAQQPAAGAQELEAKSRQPGKNKKESSGVRLPLLVEFAFTVSAILLLLLGLTMVGISFITGASLLSLVIRTSVALLVMTGLLMLISSQISAGMLNASLVSEAAPQDAGSGEAAESAGAGHQSRTEA